MQISINLIWIVSSRTHDSHISIKLHESRSQFLIFLHQNKCGAWRCDCFDCSPTYTRRSLNWPFGWGSTSDRDSPTGATSSPITGLPSFSNPAPSLYLLSLVFLSLSLFIYKLVYFRNYSYFLLHTTNEVKIKAFPAILNSAMSGGVRPCRFFHLACIRQY